MNWFETKRSWGELSSIVDGALFSPLREQETLRLDEFYAEQAMNPAMKGKQPPPNPLMMGMTKGDYMLRALESVKPAELEQTILILPFTTALSLVPFLVEWLQERKQACSFFPRTPPGDSPPWFVSRSCPRRRCRSPSLSLSMLHRPTCALRLTLSVSAAQAPSVGDGAVKQIWGSHAHARPGADARSFETPRARWRRCAAWRACWCECTRRH